MQSSQCYRFATRPYFPFSLIKVDVALQIRLWYRGRFGKRVSKRFIFVVKMGQKPSQRTEENGGLEAFRQYICPVCLLCPPKRVLAVRIGYLLIVFPCINFLRKPPKKIQAVINVTFRHFHIYLCLQFYFFIFLEKIQSMLGQKTELY